MQTIHFIPAYNKVKDMYFVSLLFKSQNTLEGYSISKRYSATILKSSLYYGHNFKYLVA